MRERGGNVLVGGGSERDVIMTKVVKRIKATGVHHQHTHTTCWWTVGLAVHNWSNGSELLHRNWTDAKVSGAGERIRIRRESGVAKLGAGKWRWR